MNWKMKAVAAALAVAAAAPASAALTPGSASAFGSLFVTVFDETLNRSYARDVGILGGAFNPNVTTTFSVNAGDTNWTSFQAGLAGADTVTGSTIPQTNLRYNIATTNNAALQNSYVSLGAGQTTNITNGGEGALAGNINNFIGNLNSANSGCGTAGSGISCFTQQSGASYNGATATPPEIWGRTMQFVAADTSGALGDQLGFYSILRNGSGFNNGKPASQSVFNGFWTFNASNASVTWNAASVGAVPVPAAAWLLGSGLMGLVGVGRRKNAVA